MTSSTSKLSFKRFTLICKGLSTFLHNTTDRRLTCGSPIEFAYYTVQHSVKGTVGRCAFCGDKLNKSATKTVKTLLEKECKVSPSCGKSVCLSMNSKANF